MNYNERVYRYGSFSNDRYTKWDPQSWGGISKESKCETGIFIHDEDVSWLNEFGGVKKFIKDRLEIIVYKENSKLSDYGEDLLGKYMFKEIHDFFIGFSELEKISKITFANLILIEYFKDGKNKEVSISLKEIKSIVNRRKYYILL